MDRNGNYETLNLGMFSARWNALWLGSASSDPGPEHRLPRDGIGQPWSNGEGETISLRKKMAALLTKTQLILLGGNMSNKSKPMIF
jgi:hypothetical protein